MVITFPVANRRAHEARGRELAEPEFRTDTVRVSAVTAMSPVLDDLSLKFAMWAGQTGKTCLDVGCGAGLASVAALARGGRIVAADPDPALLQQLLASVPVQQYARLAVRIAGLPELDFKQSGFAGVHLARVLRANSQAALENVALWHERDISHSSVERVIFPDSTILTDYLLAKTTDLLDRLLVYPERMKKNLESTGGLIFSGQLLLDLAEAGMLREDAYRLVQSHAMRSWKDDLVFRDEVAKDPAITSRLSPDKLARTFDYTRQLGNVGAIYNRVLGE